MSDTIRKTAEAIIQYVKPETGYYLRGVHESEQFTVNGKLIAGADFIALAQAYLDANPQPDPNFPYEFRNESR